MTQERASADGASARVGSLAAEATQLLDTVAIRLENWRARQEDTDTATPCPECGAVAGAPSCTGCPWCRFLAVLRGERPEVTAKLVDAASLVVSALRSMVPGPEQPGPDHPGPDHPDSHPPGSDHPAPAGSGPEPATPAATDFQAAPSAADFQAAPAAADFQAAPSAPHRPPRSGPGVQRIDIR